MPDLQKLEVVLLERHQEPVLLFLSKLGVAHYIKVDCEEELYTEFLEECPIPNDESLKNLDIQTRIKRKLEELDLTPDDVIDEVALLPGNTIKEILSNMEQKLTEIEGQSDTIIELLELVSTLIKKTGQKLQEWRIYPRKLNTKYKNHAGQQTSEEMVSEAKHNLTDINNQLEEIIGPHATEKGQQVNGDLINHVLELRSREHLEKLSIKEIPEVGPIHSTLLALQEMTLEVEVLLEAEHYMTHCDTIVYFEAWVLEEQIPKVKEGINKITNGKCVIEQEIPKSEDNVPNVIKHTPLLFEGFESLTFSLGYPRKGEINPTYLMAFTFPFLETTGEGA